MLVRSVEDDNTTKPQTDDHHPSGKTNRDTDTTRPITKYKDTDATKSKKAANTKSKKAVNRSRTKLLG